MNKVGNEITARLSIKNLYKWMDEYKEDVAAQKGFPTIREFIMFVEKKSARTQIKH